MSLRINDTAPDFTAFTTAGPISFHDWIGDGYAVLFSHPKDFTPVCTTELGYMAGLKEDFARRNCKILGISVDPVENHNKWKADIEAIVVARSADQHDLARTASLNQLHHHISDSARPDDHAEVARLDRHFPHRINRAR